MSSGSESHIRKLVGWYRSHVKPFLTKTESTKIEEFDRDSDRLEARNARSDDELDELAICFLVIQALEKVPSSTL